MDFNGLSDDEKQALWDAGEFVRDLVTGSYALYSAESIAARLPKPVDPLTLALRKLAAEHDPVNAKGWLAGRWDDVGTMRWMRAAYDLGRAEK